MTIKLGLAAVVLAGVGTFAVAEGVGEGAGGCGDGFCYVGSLQNYARYDVPVFAGHLENGFTFSSGLDIDTPNTVVGKTYVDRVRVTDTTGNCVDGVGSNGDNGCNSN
jgi:hypothetical protein